jgi:hypothetical protein
MELLQTTAGRRTERLSASSRFKGFKHEPLNDSRTSEISKDPDLERLKTAWGRCQPDPHEAFLITYQKIFEDVAAIGYSAKDIENLSLSLKAFQHESGFSVYAGLFLSALMNCSREGSFIIHTAHIDRDIVALGYKNVKDFVVDGPVGLCVGYHMEGGTIRVDGNADWNAGDGMKDGKLIVQGDAGLNVGYEMRGGDVIVTGCAGDFTGVRMNGGSITIEKDAGQMIGDGMTGGEIRLNGRYTGISRDCYGGKIFHGGKRIQPK